MMRPGYFGWAVVWLAGWAWCCWPPVTAKAGSAEAQPLLRMAISEDIAEEVNGNDLRAAVKAWAEALAHEAGIRIEPEVCNTAQLLQKVRNHEVDSFSVNIFEFERLASYAGRDLVIDESEAPAGQEYVLLVHQSSPIRSVADLRGKSLIVYRNTRTCMANIWLDELLAAARLGSAEATFSRLESNNKLPRVVLPVFFKQADACLVNRHGFNTMAELNPQIGQQLRILAVSPKLLTTFLAFRKEAAPETKQRFLSAVLNLYKSVPGRQAMLLFGSTRLYQADVSVLRTTFDLLRRYERLKPATPGTGQ